MPVRAAGSSVTGVVDQSDAGARAGAGQPVAARPAATIMVLRDGDHPSAPLEVLMLRRNVRSEFAAGAHVFPGGAVDAEDAAAAPWCEGMDDPSASAVLRLGSGGLAYWVAAVRECFEEAGLLLARSRRGGELLALDDPVLAARMLAHRRDLNARRRSFREICEAEGIALALDRLQYFAHWITPKGAPRRYDTRFFVAAAPERQAPAHDAAETVADAWLRPADALGAHRSGKIMLILPTIRVLQALQRFPTVAEALEAASRLEEVPTIEPRVAMAAGGWTLLVPGDPGYDEAGPTHAGIVGPQFDAAARHGSRRANDP